VVLLPDSGSRYLSKIFNDDWMREYGYLGYFGGSRCEASAADILKAKPRQELITVSSSDTMTRVISVMKEHAISQAPVLRDGALAGMVREVDLLNHMLMAEHEHTPDETIADIMQTNTHSVLPDTSLEELMELFTGGADVVMVVPENGDASRGGIGILTKIDVLDYVATNCI
jgi:cystathionine beta-synthase